LKIPEGPGNRLLFALCRLLDVAQLPGPSLPTRQRYTNRNEQAVREVTLRCDSGHTALGCWEILPRSIPEFRYQPNAFKQKSFCV
jgi:hypothetical protein